MMSQQTEFKGVRISRYLVYTKSVLMAAHVAARLDGKLSKGKSVKVQGSVQIQGERIKYSMLKSDLERLESGVGSNE